jgi:hypothetical protein
MVRESSVREPAHIVLLDDFVSVAATTTAAFTHVVYLKRAMVPAKLTGIL